MSRSPLRGAAIAILAGALRLYAQEAAESYEQGERLFRQGDLVRATGSFVQALSKEPRELEELRITSTYYIRPYVPHFYLGLCLVKSDPRKAREELLISRKQGVAPRHPGLKQKLDRALADLEPRAPAAAPTAPPMPSVTPQTIVVTRPTSPPPSPTTAPTTLPALAAPGRIPVPSATLAPSPRALTAEARETLRLGLTQFFLCQFAEALRTLEPLARAGDDTARLFSAYALCSTYLLRGEKEPFVLADALALYRGLPESVREKPRRGVSPHVLALLERPPGLQ